MSTLSSRDIEAAMRRRAGDGNLLTLRMDIINKCNLHCVMCHYSDPEVSRRRAVSITADDFDTWFRSIGPAVSEIMLSCGDEPLMSPHFIEILRVAAQYSDQLDIGLCTNATLMTSKVRSALLKHGVTFILFSIDGVKKATVERIRVGSKFEKIVGNIKALKALKEEAGTTLPRFTIDFVMMRSNLEETIPFVDLCKDLGAELIDYRHAVPGPYWDDDEEKLEHFPALYNAYREAILAKAAEVGIHVVLPDAYPDVSSDHLSVPESTPADLADYYAVAPDTNKEPVPIPKAFRDGFVPQVPFEVSSEFFADAYCDRPFREVMIRDQRDVAPCAWHKTLGTLGGEESVHDIFFGENFALLREKMMKGEVDESCRGCPLKGGFLP